MSHKFSAIYSVSILILSLVVSNPILYANESVARPSNYVFHKEINVKCAIDTQLSPFRYIIYGKDYIERGKKKLPVTKLYVLLEPEAFSAANLIKLQELILKRFSPAGNLYVYVFTNIKQTATPEEEDFVVADGAEDLSIRKYQRAVLMRVDGNKMIRYTPNPPDGNLITIEIK